ncbi:MAG TPA: hypothetical protein VF666_10710 [Pyrinomonadaceae bacterium]
MPSQLAVIDKRGALVVEPSGFTVSIGVKQTGFTGSADAATTGVVAGSFVVTGKATRFPLTSPTRRVSPSGT